MKTFPRWMRCIITVCALVGAAQIGKWALTPTTWNVELRDDGGVRVVQRNWARQVVDLVAIRHDGVLRWEWNRAGKWEEIPDETMEEINRVQLDQESQRP